jgi:hypothetical protein
MPTLLQSVTLTAKNMKAIALASLLALIANTAAQAAPASAPPAKVRTIKVKVNPRTITNLPNFPLSTLKTSLSPKLYKSLSVSDLTAWIVVNLPPYGGEPKIIHSEAGGQFDKLALSMAKGWGMVGYNTTESRTHQPSLNVHLLIYKIADGIMAVNFSHNDEAFHAGRQYTDAWVGVLQDGKWTRVGGTKVLRESVIEHSTGN